MTKEKGSGTKTLVEAQHYFTTKDTKSTKASENGALDPALKIGNSEVHQESEASARCTLIAQPIARFDGLSNSILRVLRALRGEFSVVSVPCEPKLDVTAYSKRQGTQTLVE